MNAMLVLFSLIPVLSGDTTEPKEKHFVFSCRVFDKTGEPVPNAKIRVVAVNEQGDPYGPDSNWSGGRTDSDGYGGLGFGTTIKPRPGKLSIVTQHPSIGEVRKTVDWSVVLHDTRPITAIVQPVIKLSAEGGPGLKEWREVVTNKAPGLVRSLVNSKDDKEVGRITDEISAGEMCSVPALYEALKDYDNPNRQRLVKCLIFTWNGCNGVGPIDKDVREKALAIFSVEMYPGILAVKPMARPVFVSWPEKTIMLKEIAWVIKNLEAEVAEADKKGDRETAQNTGWLLSKMREAEKETREYKPEK
jgi:hypothetical protein